MKQIYTGYVVDPSIQQPYTAKSVDFLREGDREMIAIIIRNIISNKGLMYSTSVPYYVGSTTNLVGFPTDGAIFFNDELYIMRENTAGLDYCIIDTTPDPVADPVVFTDSISRNVHNNRYLTFTNVASGSLFAIADIVGINLTAPTVVPKPVSAYQSFSNSLNANALDPVHLSLKCSNELFDDNNLYNTSTGVYTVPKTGYYRVTGACRLRASATLTDGDYQFNIYKNGVGYTSFTFEIYPFDGTDINIQGDMIVKANIGDTIELYTDGSFTSPSSAITYVSNIKVLFEYLYQ